MNFRLPLPGAVALLALIAFPCESREFAVVAHPGVEAAELGFSDFKKIMLGDRQFWPSGQKVVLIVRAPVAEARTLLLERVFEMTEAQYRQYWIAKVFRAEATSEPRIVLSSGEVLELVGLMPGSVSVVAAEDVPAGLKVIKIDGLLPGEEGYPLVTDEP